MSPPLLLAAPDLILLKPVKVDTQVRDVGSVPANTKKSNEWAYKNFQLWRDNRNRLYPDMECPEDLLQKPPWDPAAMSFWLSRFACETRSTAGEKYPATTVFSLLSALMRRTRSIDPDCPKFMDSTNSQFRKMHSIIDGYFRELR